MLLPDHLGGKGRNLSDDIYAVGMRLQGGSSSAALHRRNTRELAQWLLGVASKVRAMENSNGALTRELTEEMALPVPAVRAVPLLGRVS